jgi:hypothetical protein
MQCSNPYFSAIPFNYYLSSLAFTSAPLFSRILQMSTLPSPAAS